MCSGVENFGVLRKVFRRWGKCLGVAESVLVLGGLRRKLWCCEECWSVEVGGWVC